MSRRVRTIAIALALSSSTIVVAAPGAAPPAAAQARAVLVSTRTSPQLPEPGQDVSVRVTVQGCPPGPAAVELYLETDDGVSRTTELMAREPLRTSMLWTSRSDLRLDKAPGGWYGARVVCGTFRPPREPMANTRFVVGAKPTAAITLSATAVNAGGSLTVSGTACPGTAADAQLLPSVEGIEPYVGDIETAVAADGTWSITLAVPAGTKPGRVSIRARCLATNQYGRRIALPYETWLVATVTT